MSDSWFRNVLATFKGQKIGALEIYKVLLSKHAGASPTEAKQFIKEDSQDRLIRSMKYHWNQLLIPAATKVGIKTDELRQMLIGISHGTESDMLFVNCWTEFNGNRFHIKINRSLMIFFWKMAKLWATRANFKDVPNVGYEHTRFSLDQTAEVAHKLMKAYFDGNIVGTEVISALSLSPNQLQWAGKICHYVERFTLAHEIAHVFMHFMPEKLLDFPKHINVGIGSLIKSLLTPSEYLPRSDVVKDWTVDMFIDRWGEECSADIIALHLTGISIEDDIDRIVAYWAIELGLITFAMIEQYAVEYSGEDMLCLNSHPFSIVRLAELRHYTEVPPDVKEVSRVVKIVNEVSKYGAT